jgi:nitroreductase
MDVDTATRRLRVVRDFSDRPLPDGMLERLVDGARRTGSSKNDQRWAFITVTERRTLERLRRVGPYAGHLGGAAGAIALVVPTAASRSGLWDLGRAAQTMMLLAFADGIGSCPATVYEPELAREILGLPPDQDCPYILSFGYPADPEVATRPPRAGGRVPIDQVLHRERW